MEEKERIRQIAAINQQIEVGHQQEELNLVEMRRCIREREKLEAEKCPIPWFLWIPFWIPWKWYQNLRISRIQQEAQNWADKANVHVARIRKLNEQLYALRMK